MYHKYNLIMIKIVILEIYQKIMMKKYILIIVLKSIKIFQKRKIQVIIGNILMIIVMILIFHNIDYNINNNTKSIDIDEDIDISNEDFINKHFLLLLNERINNNILSIDNKENIINVKPKKPINYLKPFKRDVYCSKEKKCRKQKKNNSS